jgi:large subunit ribosomal protein L16
MLAPKRVKHRKQHRPRPLKGLSKGHTQVYVG